MAREFWKPVYGFSKFYEVSNLGRVRNRKTRHVLTPTVEKGGYLRVHLCGLDGSGDEKRRSMLVHRVVATAYVGARPGSGYEIGHLDGDPKNNAADNLDWVTKQQNAAHRIAHGTAGFGSTNHASRLTEDQVLEIRVLAKNGERNASLARKFNVSEVTIHNIVQRKKWRHI